MLCKKVGISVPSLQGRNVQSRACCKMEIFSFVLPTSSTKNHWLCSDEDSFTVFILPFLHFHSVLKKQEVLFWLNSFKQNYDCLSAVILFFIEDRSRQKSIADRISVSFCFCQAFFYYRCFSNGSWNYSSWVCQGVSVKSRHPKIWLGENIVTFTMLCCDTTRHNHNFDYYKTSFTFVFLLSSPYTR